MTIAYSVAFTSVLLGAGLAILSERFSRALGIVRWFSLVAASAVVLGHLLPDAFRELGPVALLAFLLAFALPLVAEGVARQLRGRPDRHTDAHAHDDCDHAHAEADVGMELGYAGLLVHQLGDGVALSTYATAGHSHGDHTDVLVAIGVHTIPVAALVVLSFFKHGGYSAALLRAGGMVAATWIGIAGVSLAPLSQLPGWEPWVTAVVAGLLFHVVVHDFRWSRS